MKNNLFLLTTAIVLASTLLSCNDKEELKYFEYVPCTIPSELTLDRGSELWERHHDSDLKILAIGNSFTGNATKHIPWIIKNLNGDSICFANLMLSGCSLDMHWKNHVDISDNYNLQYSDGGRWVASEIKNIDRALILFDWDIIVIQQASRYSGIYSTYQPSLNYLVRLFSETNPAAQLAWHYTWAYALGTKNEAFKDYDRNPEKMYNAIIESGDIASMFFDIRIPSATLIKRMREEFPEIENGFSEDGIHVDCDPAQYALSSLWYECLIRPYTGTSVLEFERYPSTVEPEVMVRVNDIIKSIL